METRRANKEVPIYSKQPCSEVFSKSSGRGSRVSAPGQIAQVALGLMEKWKEQEGKSGPGVPNHIQDEAWDIAFHPTKVEPLLSRKGKPIGVSRTVVKEPSFLKKAKSQ